MAKAKCTHIHPKWCLSPSSHLLQQWLPWHSAEKKIKITVKVWLLKFLISSPLGRPEWQKGACLSQFFWIPSVISPPPVLKTPCFKEKQIIKHPEQVVFCFPTSWPSQHQAEKLLCTCSREGTLTQPALAVPFSYFPAIRGGGRKDTMQQLARYSDNDWSCHKCPCFQLIIKIHIFLKSNWHHRNCSSEAVWSWGAKGAKDKKQCEVEEGNSVNKLWIKYDFLDLHTSSMHFPLATAPCLSVSSFICPLWSLHSPYLYLPVSG